ncbi:hypothetical protein [Nocardiopsis metallicus]|uniref:hypothetical protein n=1 Tax=Nocardiopsis metallicus TaxID=179819 RepID=UPI001FEA1873|nr:hypothetical protein [Nocardiopsis metallicus]
MDDQRDVILTNDAVLADGRELNGEEIGELMKQLEPLRLETLWREVHRHYPLGTWVTVANSKRTRPDEVIGYQRGRPGTPGHMLKIRTHRGDEIRVPVAEARVVPPTEGGTAMIRLFLCLLGSVLRPVRSDVRSRPAPSAAVPPVPRQARRTFDRVIELLAREHPDWRVFAIPTDRGRCFVAKKEATTVYADTAEEISQRIRSVDEEPEPDMVRSYIDWRVPA